MIVLSTAVVYPAILLYTRIVGLRSFSKISASDFAMTVAVGALFGSIVATPSPTLLVGLLALAALYAGQWLFAWLRRQFPGFSNTVDNTPILLMAGARIFDGNLDKAKVTRNDLFAKLREANALNYGQVLAVIFETTGDISVLHSNKQDVQLERDFLLGVEDADRLFETQSELSSASD
jgi:uncharacterized membrane protein YcaP (DUF421 family)